GDHAVTGQGPTASSRDRRVAGAGDPRGGVAADGRLEEAQRAVPGDLGRVGVVLVGALLVHEGVGRVVAVELVVDAARLEAALEGVDLLLRRELVDPRDVGLEGDADLPHVGDLVRL